MLGQGHSFSARLVLCGWRTWEDQQQVHHMCNSSFCYFCRRQLLIPDVCHVCGSSCMAHISRCSLYCIQLIVREYLFLTHTPATMQILECKQQKKAPGLKNKKNIFWEVLRPKSSLMMTALLYRFSGVSLIERNCRRPGGNGKDVLFKCFV